MKKYLSNKKNRPSVVLIGLCLALLCCMPMVSSDPYLIHVVLLCMLYSCLTSAWNLIAGFAGVFNFGFQALFGIGAYVSALTVMKLGISPWIGIFLGAICAMIVSTIIATPCIKLKKIPYICIATTAMGEIVRLVVKNTPNLTRGEQGLIGIPELFPSGLAIHYYYFVFVLFIVVIGAMVLIVYSPMGMSLSAIKGSQDAADSLGINVPGMKIKIYMIGAFIAGLVGGVYAHYIGVLTPSTVLIGTFMTQIVAMALLGGLGTIVGPIIGSFIITGSLELLREFADYRMVAYALLIIVTIIFLRQGLWGSLRGYVFKLLEKLSGVKKEAVESEK